MIRLGFVIFVSVLSVSISYADSEPVGYLCQPAYSIDGSVRGPLKEYTPQSGDIVLMSDANELWRTAYFFAITAEPGHAGMIVKMSDGTIGILEAGADGTLCVKLQPLSDKLKKYNGRMWVRTRKTPLTKEQETILTTYAETIHGKGYAAGRLLLQLTPFRARGPVKILWCGKPQGIRSRYLCSEAVLEGLVLAGLLDAETTRPGATYPEDIFYDKSSNWYVNKHLNIKEGWEIPALLLRTENVKDGCPKLSLSLK